MHAPPRTQTLSPCGAERSRTHARAFRALGVGDLLPRTDPQVFCFVNLRIHEVLGPLTAHETRDVRGTNPPREFGGLLGRPTKVGGHRHARGAEEAVAARKRLLGQRIERRRKKLS